MKTLIIIDGHALAFREYFALERTGMSTTDNRPTWAVFGFFKAIFDILRIIKPDAIAVTFDVSKKTFRTEKYDGYKANREAMPDNMKIQMDAIKEGLKAFNIPIYTKEGFEADDVIGTISKQMCKLGHRTYILTGDQDSFQLIDKEGYTEVLIPYKGDLIFYNWKKVHEKLGVYPNQVIDYKALRGDTSDNIPGVKGIGEKTAQKLLKEFRTLEKVYNNIDKISSNSVRSKLIAGKESAELSKYLATIVTDLDINFDIENAYLEIPNVVNITKFFTEMQFFGFLKNFDNIMMTFKNAYKTAEETTIKQRQLGLFSAMAEKMINNEHTDFEFETVENNNINNLIGILNNQKLISVYIGSMENDTNIISGISFGIKDENSKIKTFYLEANQNLKSNLKLLKPVFENPNIEKTIHDAKHGYILLKKYGINLKGIVFDPMLASYVKDPSRRHELKNQALEHLNYLVNENNDNNFNEYSYSVYKLTDFWKEELDEKELKLVRDVEVPLSTILAEMEIYGVSVDIEYLKQLSKEYDEHLTSLEKTIFKQAGCEFNVKSAKQVSDVIYKKLKIKPIRQGKTKFSTTADVLEELSAKYKICDYLLDYRQFLKLKTTYADALQTLISKEDGKIHTNFNQTITTTGRLSSSNPNLQNIPTRSQVGMKIRQAFVPKDRKNQVLVSADYSQIELRLLAHCSNDECLIEAFNAGKDIHAETAAKVFDVDIKDVTKEMRQKAKVVNFGIVYGQSYYGLSQALGIQPKDAKIFITKYFETYPMVKDYMQRTIDFVNQNGYVETIFGRKRYLSTELASTNKFIKEAAERAAINQPLQGSAADLIKMAMITLYGRLTELKLKSKIILQVHDELIIETPLDELDIVKTIVKEAMELNQPLKVPLLVDIAFGKNWIEL